MQTIRSDRFLRNVLFLDAATCTGCGLSMVLAARPFGQLANLPPELLLYAGLSLLPIAGFFAWVGAKALDSAAALSAVIGGNLPGPRRASGSCSVARSPRTRSGRCSSRPRRRWCSC